MLKIVVNSTPIISLAILDKLTLLTKLYDQVYIPQAVYDEVCKEGESKAGAKALKNADFIEIVSIKNKEARDLFSTSLHKGEIEVMVLAKELEADLIIIDDYQARKHAKYLDFKITGTLGVLLKAKKNNYIENIKFLLDKLIKNDIYIGDNLYKKILNMAGE